MNIFTLCNQGSYLSKLFIVLTTLYTVSQWGGQWGKNVSPGQSSALLIPAIQLTCQLYMQTSHTVLIREIESVEPRGAEWINILHAALQSNNSLSIHSANQNWFEPRLPPKGRNTESQIAPDSSASSASSVWVIYDRESAACALYECVWEWVNGKTVL